MKSLTRKLEIRIVTLSVVGMVFLSQSIHAGEFHEKDARRLELIEMTKDAIRLESMDRDRKELEFLRLEERMLKLRDHASTIEVSGRIEELELKLKGLLTPQVQTALRLKQKVRKEAEQLEMEYRFAALKNQSLKGFAAQVKQLEAHRFHAHKSLELALAQAKSGEVAAQAIGQLNIHSKIPKASSNDSKSPRKHSVAFVAYEKPIRLAENHALRLEDKNLKKYHQLNSRLDHQFQKQDHAHHSAFHSPGHSEPLQTSTKKSVLSVVKKQMKKVFSGKI